MTQISGELALSIIRSAFAPLHCGAEIYDGNRIRFNVVNSVGESIAKLASVESEEFTDTERLELLLNRVRDDINAYTDVALDSWTMPVVKLL